MDRKVFSMIAATVFLLVMIIATIQMQISMIEKAADDIESDFAGYGYPIAGSLYILNHDSTDTMGYIQGDELGSSLSSSSDGGCKLVTTGDVEPGFADTQLLQVEHNITKINPDCTADSQSYNTYGSTYGRYATAVASAVTTRGTSLDFTFMRKEDSGGETKIHPETIKVVQKRFQP